MDMTHSFMSQQNNWQLQLRHWAPQSDTIEVASTDWRPLPCHTLALSGSFISFLATSGLFKSNHIVTVVQNSHYNLTPLTTKTLVPMPFATAAPFSTEPPPGQLMLLTLPSNNYVSMSSLRGGGGLAVPAELSPPLKAHWLPLQI